VVRNGCDHRAPAGEGAHLRKIVNDWGAQAWVPCNADGSWRTPADEAVMFAPSDVHLPVQVVMKGKSEYE